MEISAIEQTFPPLLFKLFTNLIFNIHSFFYGVSLQFKPQRFIIYYNFIVGIPAISQSQKAPHQFLHGSSEQRMVGRDTQQQWGH